MPYKSGSDQQNFTIANKTFYNTNWNYQFKKGYKKFMAYNINKLRQNLFLSIWLLVGQVSIDFFSFKKIMDEPVDDG